MLTFIKRLLGFAPDPVKTQEEVKAIFIPQKATTEPVKVRAIVETGSDAIKAAHAPKPANKKRRPYRGNKVKPAVTEGNTKGGNNTVKPAQVAKAKPAKPKAPVAKK